MSAFTYTATRQLAAGTVQDSLVSRDFRLLTSRPTRNPVAKRNTALSGAVESLLHRSKRHYNCQTETIDPGTLIDQRVEEFLASVENAEGFTFDRFGTVSVPDDPVSCIMVSTSFPTNEVAKLFNQYTFVIRES